MSQVLSQQIETAYREKFPTSAKLYERGVSLFPSGVTHDGRYLQPFPIYVERALGSKKYDVDGSEIIDYWVGHGAMLLGHSHPAVVEAVQQQAARSTHPGACHELELIWGEWVRKLVPSAEQMRFTNSGTEATLMALRVARIISGKQKVIKFVGHFHGWHDLLTPGNEPPEEAGGYSLPGLTDGVVGDVVLIPPNDIEAVARAIEEHDPCCVIHEGNGMRWGVVPAEVEYVQALRQLSADKGVLFILDEVITGFRVAPGGYQEVCDIVPDMTTLAKVLAGGLPGGCLTGRADVLDALAFGNSHGQKMKHPGTYNGNPLSAAAGAAALEVVSTGEPCRHANEIAAKLRGELNGLFQQKGIDWISYGRFSAVKILPEYDGPPSDGDAFIPYNNDPARLDRKFPATLSHVLRCALLLGGVDWMGWAGSTTLAHSDDDVERTVTAFAGAIDMLRADGLVG
jgi:glutamate-1-semialdehyde 2,1-aminomutase